MLHFTDTLQQETEKRLNKIESSEDTVIDRAAAASDLLEEALFRLKEFVIDYVFTDEAEEIFFFKEIKPRMMSKLLFHRKVYDIELNKPVGSQDTLAAYLHGELKRLNEYACKHIDFYRYYRSKASHFDHFYFLRNAERMRIRSPHDFPFERDPAFSTAGDFIVAMILAGEMLQTYLLKELNAPEQWRRLDHTTSPEVRLTWQGSKAELYEQIFAWHAKGSFGEIPLTHLSAYVQRVFNIELNGNLTRTLADMKLRNNPTPYLDSLTDALLLRMKREKKKQK